MEAEDSSSSAAGRSRKRQRVDTKLPQMMELTSTRWKHHNRLYSALPAELSNEASEVQVLNSSRQFSLLRLLNRGCRRYTITETEPLGPNSFYVGIDGVDFAPLVLREFSYDGINMENNNEGAGFALGKKRRKKDPIIPPLDMLRPNQMTFLKAHSTRKRFLREGQEVRDISAAERDKFEKEQGDNFRNGFACSVLVDKPELELDFNSLPHTTPQTWEGFRMTMPKIAGKIIPQTLIEKLKSFLSKYPKDLVELTFALSMAIVWCRLSAAPLHQPEVSVTKSGSAVRVGDRRRKVPKPPLAVFLMYATHFFRFHDEHRLAAYGHIFRYVCAMYRNDCCHNQAFLIKAGDIEEEMVIDLVSKIELDEDDWIEIIPPSWEGSQLPMPRNSGCRAIQSEETTAWLMLPDIHTIGLPCYRNEMRFNRGEVFRNVIVHDEWVTPALSAVKDHCTDTFLSEEAMQLRSSSDEPRLWCVPKTRIRASWRDIVSPKDGRPGQGTPSFSIPGQISPSPEQVQQAAPEPSENVSQIKEFVRKLAVQFRLAREKGLILPDVRLEDTGLTWEGMLEESKYTKQLPGNISIAKMVAEDAALEADLLSSRDCAILQRLIHDIYYIGNIPDCIRTARPAMNTLQDSESRSTISATLHNMSQPLETAMNRIAEYGNGNQQGELAFITHIIKPCCLLMDIHCPENPGVSHRAITECDFEVGMAVSDIMYLRMLPDTGSLRDAVQRLKHSVRFLPSLRVLLFKEKLMGIKFDEERKQSWEKAFGEPFDDSKE